MRKRSSSLGWRSTKAAISRGAKYFAVETTPTESRPPWPGSDRLHRLGEFAHRALDADAELARDLARRD